MGLLDDAIREHLELKRQHGADPSEVARQEREALGRWRGLSAWRKAVALGAFSVGTFGLGFTLGGLIFGRWRRA